MRLERWYNVDIEVLNNELMSLHYDGIIEKETIEQVLEIIKLTIPIEYTMKHKEISIGLNKNYNLKTEF